MTSNQRRDISNGIWLCQNCAKLIDNDDARYRVDVLRQWRVDAEAIAQQALEQRNPAVRAYRVRFETRASARRPELQVSVINDSTTVRVGVDSISLHQAANNRLLGMAMSRDDLQTGNRIAEPGLSTVIRLHAGMIVFRLQRQQWLDADAMGIRMDHEEVPTVYAEPQIQQFLNQCRAFFTEFEIRQWCASEESDDDDSTEWLRY